jgi:hypothetical protein
MQNFFSFGRIFSQNLQTTRVGTWQQWGEVERGRALGGVGKHESTVSSGAKTLNPQQSQELKNIESTGIIIICVFFPLVLLTVSLTVC